MSSKVILVYNPIAHGGKLAEKTKNAVLNNFDSAIIHPIKPYEGDGFGNLFEVVNKYRPEFLIVAGGDGTLNRYFNYAFRNGISNIPIGIIPSGTANDFAGSLGIANDIDKAIEIIKIGTRQKTDIISVTSGEHITYCINVFSSGYLTCVSHSTNDCLKKWFGKLAYFIHGIGEALTPKRMNLKVLTNNIQFEGKALLILAMNGKTAGGMSFSCTADPCDGMIDITIFKGDNLFKTLASAINIFLGKPYHLDVIHDRCSSIEIDNSDMRETDLDGDKGPEYPIILKCLKGAITVIR